MNEDHSTDAHPPTQPPPPPYEPRPSTLARSEPTPPERTDAASPTAPTPTAPSTHGIPVLFASPAEHAAAHTLAKYRSHTLPSTLDAALLHLRCCHLSALVAVPDPAVGGDSTEGTTVDAAIAAAKYCLCCGHVAGPFLPVDTQLESLERQGLVFPYYQLFMRYLWWCVALFSVVGVGMQVPILVANCSGKKDPDSGVEYDCGFYLSTFLNPRARDATTRYTDYSAYIILVILVGYVCGYALFLVSKSHLVQRLRQKYIGVQEFAVGVEDLSEKQAVDIAYLQGVVNRGLLKPLPKVASINPVRRDLSKFPVENQLRDEIAKLESIKKLINAETPPSDNIAHTKGSARLQTLRKLERSSENAVKSLKRSLANQKERSTIENPKEHIEMTVVTFETREQAFRVHRVASIVKWASYLLCSCCWKKKVHRIRSVEAPEDMNWKGLGAPKIKIVGLMILTNFILLICVGILNNFARSIGQDIYEFGKTYKGDNKSTWSNFVGDQFIKIISLITIIFNNLLAQTIKLVKGWNIEESRSAGIDSERSRISLMLTIHTITAPIFISYVSKDDGSKESSEVTNFFLSQLVFNFLLINAFLGPILMAFKPAEAYRLLVTRPWIKRQFAKSEDYGLNYTQKELNEIFTPPAPDFATRYSYPVVVLFTSLFFFELVPLGMPLCLLYLYIQIWVDSKLFLRVYSKPQDIDREYLLLAAGVFRRGLFLLPLGHIYAKLGLYRPDLSFNISDVKGLDYILIFLGTSSQAMEGIEVWIVQQVEKLFRKNRVVENESRNGSQAAQGTTLTNPQSEQLLEDKDEDQPHAAEGTASDRDLTAVPAKYRKLERFFDINYEHFNTYTSKKEYLEDEARFADQLTKQKLSVLRVPVTNQTSQALQIDEASLSNFSAQMLTNELKMKLTNLKRDLFGPNYKAISTWKYKDAPILKEE